MGPTHAYQDAWNCQDILQYVLQLPFPFQSSGMSIRLENVTSIHSLPLALLLHPSSWSE